MLHCKFKNAVFSSLLRFGSFNFSKQISLVTIFLIGFIANKETLVFFYYLICWKQRSLSELAWCARDKRPCELQKSLRRKLVLFRSGILEFSPSNLNEDRKKKKKRKSLRRILFPF